MFLRLPALPRSPRLCVAGAAEPPDWEADDGNKVFDGLGGAPGSPERRGGGECWWSRNAQAAGSPAEGGIPCGALGYRGVFPLPAAGPAGGSPASQPAADDQRGTGLGVVAGEAWTVAADGDADAEGEDSDDCVDAEDDADGDWEEPSDASTDSEDGVTEFLLLPEGKSDWRLPSGAGCRVFGLAGLVCDQA